MLPDLLVPVNPFYLIYPGAGNTWPRPSQPDGLRGRASSLCLITGAGQGEPEPVRDRAGPTGVPASMRICPSMRPAWGAEHQHQLMFVQHDPGEAAQSGQAGLIHQGHVANPQAEAGQADAHGLQVVHAPAS